MRSQLQKLPVEAQAVVLSQYRESRDSFRKWLNDQLVEGVHYGFPPGLLPKTRMIDGVKHFEMKSRSGSTWVSSTQWQPKPSLYKAGADFVIELMAVRDSYAPDREVWEMMGSIKNEVCIKCELFDRVSGEKIADGHGFGSRGDKGDWDGKGGNSAIKMASKRAKVAAVLNAFGLSDLFTQDTEDRQKPEEQPEVSNPVQTSAAPREVPTRSDGGQSPGPRGTGAVEIEELRLLFSRWVRVVKREAEGMGDTANVSQDNFIAYLSQFVKKDSNDRSVLEPSSWTRVAFRDCERDLTDSEAALGL
jgi:hypothetical protein